MNTLTRSLVTIFTSLSLASTAISEQKQIIIEAEKNLSLINKSLEILESKFRTADYHKGCIEALNAAKLIENSINSLKLIEPNYDWIEIREVLLEISNKKCPELIQ